jgi:hypothetical protein
MGNIIMLYKKWLNLYIEIIKYCADTIEFDRMIWIKISMLMYEVDFLQSLLKNKDKRKSPDL